MTQDLKKKNIEVDDIEKLTFLALKKMKKGFITALILTILSEKSLHGYGIKKEIDKKTQGIWSPFASSIYQTMSSLEGKGLVKFSEEKEMDGRIRRIYKITKKGQRYLKYFIQKFQTLMNRLRTFTFGAFGVDGNYPLDDNMLNVMSNHPVFGWKNTKSSKEKRKIIIDIKNNLEERIIFQESLIKELEKELIDIK